MLSRKAVTVMGVGRTPFFFLAAVSSAELDPKPNLICFRAVYLVISVFFHPVKNLIYRHRESFTPSLSNLFVLLLLPFSFQGDIRNESQ